MTDDRRSDSELLHRLINSLPRHNGSFLRDDVPENGIYFFFEEGEYVTIHGLQSDRIVRIGTHRKDGRHGTRLRLHYRGKRSNSIFRRHVGAALLASGQLPPSVIDQLAATPAANIPEFEAAISAQFEERFSFACIHVEAAEDRRWLEEGLIGLFASFPLALAGESWLGRNASRREIQMSGLWNVQHIAASALTPADCLIVQSLCSSASLPTTG